MIRAAAGTRKSACGWNAATSRLAFRYEDCGAADSGFASSRIMTGKPSRIGYTIRQAAQRRPFSSAVIFTGVLHTGHTSKSSNSWLIAIFPFPRLLNLTKGIGGDNRITDSARGEILEPRQRDRAARHQRRSSSDASPHRRSSRPERQERPSGPDDHEERHPEEW